jgi:hypothetical protein
VNVDEFWGLIARSDKRRFDSEERADWLIDRLAGLPPSDIVDFRRHLDRLRAPLDTYRLWGAACLVCGGSAEDGFWNFQFWVVGLGRGAYERVLADPEALADVEIVRLLAADEAGEDEEPAEWEALDYVAEEAYEEVTGEDLVEVLAAGGYESPSGPRPRDTPFDIDDETELARRYPRLAALFPALELDYA